MKRSFIKILAIILIIGLNWTGLSAVIKTIAYYNDTEISQGNNYSAGILDFSLSPQGDFSPDVTPASSSSRTISIVNDGILGFQYTIQTSNATGTLCDYLNLEAILNGTSTYTESLTSFNFNAGEFSTSTDHWQFKATLTSNDSALQNKTCTFDFVFNGTQIGGVGFSDQEIIQNTITSGIWQKVVINKVYYDVDAQHGVEYDNEWIEIYNPLDNPVDISGWIIADSTSTDTIPTSAPIPGHGFAIITGNSSTWGYWNIPNDVVKIVLTDGKIGGDGLDNDSDRVILKLPSGTIDDAMSYGADTYAFVPPCSDVAEGHILARVQTGIDTDTASDWKDLGLPQVTVIWPNGGEVLYVGQTYNIEWTAINPNGTSTALTIDIWYSKDSGNSWAKITSTSTTENDGVYEWRIPLFIGSYYVPSHNARIKVVAFGPENFMMQAWDMSDFDFCPPIDYSLLTDEEKAQVEQLLVDGILTEADIISRGITDLEEALKDLELEGGENTTSTEEVITTIIEEIATTTEDVATTTISEETTTTTTIPEDIMTTTTTIPPITEEVSVEETPVIEETPVNETLVIEQTPAIEEQPVIAPVDNNSGEQALPADNSSTGGGETVSATPSDGVTE